MSTAPALDAARFARAFPFHLWLDADLRLRGFGASLRKALPSLREGDRLDAVFDVRRPRNAVTLDDWRRHGPDLCTLKARADGPPITLRGNAEVLDDGSLLLLVTPVLGTLEELRALGLGFNDFARHDAIGEMLLLARTTQTAAADAERLAQRLTLRTQQLDMILELGQNGVLAFGANGRVLRVNEALLRMLGLERSALSGMDLAAVKDCLDERLAPGERSLADLGDDALPGGDAVQRTLRLAVPRPTVLHLNARRSADGSFVLYLRDQTAESEVDRMKSEFLSAAAHELRTPMVSIFGFTELLLNRPVGEARRRDMLETIHRQAGLLIGIVNELLDLARIEARQGKDLHRQPHRLADLVGPTVDALAAVGARERIVVDPAHGDAMLMVDGAKTMQALTNVLSNAVKYSPAGGPIRIAARPGRVGDAPALGLAVSDGGIGMTPEQVGRVFERFYRADPSGNIPGTGLGMSLVKEIAELQGGRVELESELGRGTTVTLWLPLCTAAGERAQGLPEARLLPAHA